MRIGICDDDIIFLRYLESVVKGHFLSKAKVEIDALLPETLCSVIKNQEVSFDLLIMDIDLEECNGIEVVRRLQKKNSFCNIIFVSGYLTFAMDVYEVEHIYFVVKSKLEEILPKALDKAYTIYKNNKKDIISFRFKNVQYQIRQSDIMYVEAYGRYLFLHGVKQKYQCINTMRKMEEELSLSFSRCHNSYIVNMNYVHSVTRTGCVLSNGVQIPVSNNYSKCFQSDYIRFVSECVTT